MTIDLHNGLLKLWPREFEKLMFSPENPYSNTYSNAIMNNQLSIKEQITLFHQRKRMLNDT